MKMYLASKIFPTAVRPIEVSKVTDKSVILMDGHRRALETTYEAYFSTFKEAKDWLVFEAELELHKRKQQQLRAEMDLAQAKALTEETEA